jgi:NTP pyrophosphatase (non-canonical NTP hydrolase)
MREEIKRFAEAMEEKMSKHDDDREDSWKRESPKWLFDRLMEETSEAKECTENLDGAKFCEELIDIANFAMMAFHLTAKYSFNE